jgi:hypothetical protein
MARKHGKRGAILMSVNGTSEPVKVLSMAEFSFDDEPDRTDVTCYEDKNTQSVQGFPTGGTWEANGDMIVALGPE